MRAAALVLLRCALAVLVRPDRDVLGAVVGGEVALAEREQRRCQRECSGGELLHGRGKTSLADGTSGDPRSGERGEHPGPLEGKARLGRLRRTRGSTSSASSSRAGPAQQGPVPRQQPLRAARDVNLAVVGPDCARPGRRPVDEHAVRERHPSQADLFLGHHDRLAIGRLPAQHDAGTRRRARGLPR